jgi:hypothetical protein
MVGEDATPQGVGSQGKARALRGQQGRRQCLVALVVAALIGLGPARIEIDESPGSGRMRPRLEGPPSRPVEPDPPTEAAPLAVPRNRFTSLDPRSANAEPIEAERDVLLRTTRGVTVAQARGR